MKHNSNRNLILLGLLFCAGFSFNMRAENVSTPLFTADIKNVITMYAAPDAQTFYLHTEDSLYTVSRDGQILSIVPSKVKYGCCEDSILYIHQELDNLILTQTGDTVFYAPRPEPGTGGDIGWLTVARFMCCKDGVFYWYRGVSNTRQGGSRSTCFYAIPKDGEPKNICWWNGPFSGCVIVDDWFVFIQNRGFRFLYLPDPHYDDIRTLHQVDEFKDPAGLVSYGEELYTWSNDRHAMLVFPRSYLREMATNIDKLQVEPQDSSPLFDLQGRPVDVSQPGIFIQNGKKILGHRDRYH